MHMKHWAERVCTMVQCTVTYVCVSSRVVGMKYRQLVERVRGHEPKATSMKMVSFHTQPSRLIRN